MLLKQKPKILKTKYVLISLSIVILCVTYASWDKVSKEWREIDRLEDLPIVGDLLKNPPSGLDIKFGRSGSSWETHSILVRLDSIELLEIQEVARSFSQSELVFGDYKLVPNARARFPELASEIEDAKISYLVSGLITGRMYVQIVWLEQEERAYIYVQR